MIGNITRYLKRRTSLRLAGPDGPALGPRMKGPVDSCRWLGKTGFACLIAGGFAVGALGDYAHPQQDGIGLPQNIDFHNPPSPGSRKNSTAGILLPTPTMVNPNFAAGATAQDPAAKKETQESTEALLKSYSSPNPGQPKPGPLGVANEESVTEETPSAVNAPRPLRGSAGNSAARPPVAPRGSTATPITSDLGRRGVGPDPFKSLNSREAAGSSEKSPYDDELGAWNWKKLAWLGTIPLAALITLVGLEVMTRRRRLRADASNVSGPKARTPDQLRTVGEESAHPWFGLLTTSRRRHRHHHRSHRSRRHSGRAHRTSH